MKNVLLGLIAAFFIIFAIFSCKDKTNINLKKSNASSGLANTSPHSVDFALKGDPAKQMSLSYMDGSNKHYLKIYSLIDTLQLAMHTPSQDTLIAYGNFRAIELFYHGSDTLLYAPPYLSNTPININNFKVEVYDSNHSLVSTHDLYFKVFAAFRTATTGYKYDVKWDGISLQKEPSYQSTAPNHGNVGFQVN